MTAPPSTSNRDETPKDQTPENQTPMDKAPADKAPQDQTPQDQSLQSRPFRFLDLAGEIRNKIYTLVVEDTESLRYIQSKNGYVSYKACNLAKTCWQVAREMASISGCPHLDRLAFLIDLTTDLPPLDDFYKCICSQPLRSAEIIRFSPITAFLASLPPAAKEYFLETPIVIVAEPQSEPVYINSERCKLLCLLAKMAPEAARYRVIGLESEDIYGTRVMDAVLRKDLKHLTRVNWTCDIQVPHDNSSVDLYMHRKGRLMAWEYHMMACWSRRRPQTK
ncbi:MAG: hypothetical protein M1821_004827 [Bathelium mastoideum]|nr:MAG: hypothetical protein M1821_004827 [Bathelium mastoideum]